MHRSASSPEAVWNVWETSQVLFQTAPISLRCVRVTQEWSMLCQGFCLFCLTELHCWISGSSAVFIFCRGQSCSVQCEINTRRTKIGMNLFKEDEHQRYHVVVERRENSQPSLKSTPWRALSTFQDFCGHVSWSSNLRYCNNFDVLSYNHKLLFKSASVFYRKEKKPNTLLAD